LLQGQQALALKRLAAVLAGLPELLYARLALLPDSQPLLCIVRTEVEMTPSATPMRAMIACSTVDTLLPEAKSVSHETGRPTKRDDTSGGFKRGCFVPGCNTLTNGCKHSSGIVVLVRLNDF
jgi:hypothetical protein